MKYMVINKTDLSNKQIGEIIDLVIQESKEDTIYYGKIDICVVKISGREIRVQIRYLKSYVEWRFTEVIV